MSSERGPRPRWLNPAELDDWRAVMALIMRLPPVLGGQLLRDTGLSFIEYSTLAILSAHKNHAIRLSELATLTNTSLSRLSHLVSRLEGRDLVRREADPDDGRYTRAALTEPGYELLKSSAPGHVDWVRTVVLDAVTAEEFHQLGRAASKIVENLTKFG